MRPSLEVEKIPMITATSTLRAIALESPSTIRVFERLQLDYCCGGNRALSDACAQKGLDVETVLAQITEAENSTRAASEDLTQATLSALIRHIVATHHTYIRGELPRLSQFAQRCATKHGPSHPELVHVESQLATLAEDLLFHLNKEERILFPYIESLEASRNGNGEPPHACFASVESPIAAMVHEHESAGALLSEMRTATNGFTPPEGACPTLVGFLHSLDAFERDLHRHVHLENNLLFPRAIALERETIVQSVR
jgi:regulator of cell morphogenesis and NO signaling